ncbi:MAG TPA: hypothetical protein VF974_03350 [Patescibacteria group bacterium]
MLNINERFFSAFSSAFPNKTVFTANVPKEMMASQVDKEGWFQWNLLKGTIPTEDYKKIESQYDIKLPDSFIEWHQSYFFLSGDCSLVRLPYSNPSQPLQAIKAELDWHIPQKLIPQKIYPFGSEGNDSGPLVFDGRKAVPNNEFPIRVYDQDFRGDLEGLSEVIFSSFSKLLECLTHYMTELKTKKDFEIIPAFFEIDPEGAGKKGIDYWLLWISGLRSENEEFGD